MSPASVCEICKEMNALLAKFHDNGSNELFDKDDLLIVINFVNIWNQKHCLCCFKDSKNFVRFDNLVQSIVVTSFRLLQEMIKSTTLASFSSNNNVQSSNDFDPWTSEDKEKLLHLNSKVFQLNFPLYVIYKHSNITENDELTSREVKTLSSFCDLSDFEIPTYLLRKIFYFIESDGFGLFMKCFENANLSLFAAHSLISVVQSIKNYFQPLAITHKLAQLRGCVIGYLCKIQDDDLRIMNNRNIFESIWTVVRDYNLNLGIDKDGLQIALKYFSSTTLTMRLSGITQINNYISNYEVQTNSSNPGLENLVPNLVDWILENKIIENIFGPNSHVEVIKQSHFILGFIASRITVQHIDIIWSSALMKHYEKYVFDIVSQLIKKLKLKPVFYLYNLLWKLKPKEHNEHTLNLASQIIKYLWSVNGIQPDMITNCQYIPNDKCLFDENMLSKNSLFNFLREPLNKTSSTDNSSVDVSEDDDDDDDFDCDINTTSPMCVTQNPMAKLDTDESSSESEIDIEINEFTSKSKNYNLISENIQIDDEKEDEEEEWKEVPVIEMRRQSQSEALLRAETEKMEMITGSSSVKENNKADEKSKEVDNTYEYEFILADICKQGSTLLWDIIQDDSLNQLNEEVASAAEKIFWNTICCAGNRDIRLKFIDGCLDNLAMNRSVITSLRLLHKLFFSFYQDSKLIRKIIIDAEKQKNMLKLFFHNLYLYMSEHKRQQDEQQQQQQQQSLKQKNMDGEINETSNVMLKSKFYSHKEEIQIRLNFLAFIYALPHESLLFSEEHINILWKVFTTFGDAEIMDEFFNWLLNQLRMNKTIRLELVRHLLYEKMPQLHPEAFSLVSLELLQHSHAIILGKDCEGSYRTGSIVIKLLWSIAFKNPNNDVSMNAIRHLNNYYINLVNFTSKFDKEEEFIQQCMSHLKDASIYLPIDCDKSLAIIERAVIFIKTHLESFYGRYSYFFRELKISSDIDLSMHKICDKGDTFRVWVNAPSNVKTSMEFTTADYIGDLRAEVQCWYNSLLAKNNVSNGDNMVYLIIHDHEIPFEYDEKKLVEIGFKDTQMNHVTFNPCKHPMVKQFGEGFPFSVSPEFLAFFKRKNPKNLLLQSHNFELLFTLMQQLDTIHITNLKARIFSRNIWEIIQLLPTSSEILKYFTSIFESHSEIDEGVELNDTKKAEFQTLYEKLFPSNSNQKIIYSCQIVEYFIKQDRKSSHVFINTGALDFLFNLLVTEVESVRYSSDWTEWKQDCIASLIQLIYQFAIFSFGNDNEKIVASGDILSGNCKATGSAFSVVDTMKKPKRSRKNSLEKSSFLPFNNRFLALIKNREKLVKVLLAILDNVSNNSKLIYQTSIWSRAQVVNFTLTFFISWCNSDIGVVEIFYKMENCKEIMKKLILNDLDQTVRKETCNAFLRLCLGPTHEGATLHPYIPIFLKLLLSFIEEALIINVPNFAFMIDERPSFGSGSKDYFTLLCRLIEKLVANNQGDLSAETNDIDLDQLCHFVARSIIERKCYETRKNTIEDEGLRGLLFLLTVLIRSNPGFKTKPECHELINEIFKSLFMLPSQSMPELPKCKAPNTRSSAFELLLELVRGNEENYICLTDMLMDQHRHEVMGRTSAYPWEYWPHEDSRSDCGFVGLTNLGATCYLATSMQHLFMLPEARNAILATDLTSVIKHEPILRELQRMFIFLQESERKAYNPKNFCKVYTMDHQPLNICEQKDMTEFFTDLVTKLEDMTVDLKNMVKRHFSGSLSNNVVSLDCDHISQTTEEFYTLRCQVSDMRDLYESLNEVTIKDTLEGDNMYNCEKCGKKVRAEKRACVKKLPKILCINTMRYTFNMLTMSREKVNTHFSFPFMLDMAPYLEKNLINLPSKRNNEIAQGEAERSFEEKKKKLEPETEEECTKYELIGVTVHTGTADGGHYYSFIQDRDPSSLTKGKWFLFNDAEVKSFEKEQIPAECFGGEMTSKTYDQVNDKFLDFSFEKTNSAYMVFYERIDSRSKAKENEAKDQRQQMQQEQSTAIISENVSNELLTWIRNDNLSFIRDRYIFAHSYFEFMWQVCCFIPTSLSDDFSANATLISTRLGTAFVLETLIHAKEKPTTFHWIETLTKQFQISPQACEWLVNHLAEDEWWLIQILFKCSNKTVRQLFVRLCIHVINMLKPRNTSHVYVHHHPALHPHSLTEAEMSKAVFKGTINPNTLLQPSVIRFITRLLSLINVEASSLKQNFKYLSEYFSLLYEFSKQGDEECRFFLSNNTISKLVNFYLNFRKLSIDFDSTSDNEDDDYDDRSAPMESEKLPKMAPLHHMITLIANLLEKSQNKEALPLSNQDYDAVISSRTLVFLQYQITDNINPKGSFNIMNVVFRIDETLLPPILNILFLSLMQCNPFPDHNSSYFKVMSFIAETAWLAPYFQKIILSRFWEIGEHAPLATIEWLLLHVVRNKVVNTFVLQTLNQWVFNYLIESNQNKVRNRAGELAVALVPGDPLNHQSLRTNNGFRSFPYAIKRDVFLSDEQQMIVDELFCYLINLIKRVKPFFDVGVHGPQRLTQYFYTLGYLVNFTKKRNQFILYFTEFWNLFEKKLSDQSLPVNANKQAFFLFFYLICQEHRDTIRCIVTNSMVYKKLPLTYIVADNDDQEVIHFNKNFLPYYYGLYRLCCEYSRPFTRYLATHSNTEWAFKNITPCMNNYQLAVGELFKLMRLFITVYPDTTDEELNDIISFKHSTIKLYLNNLDPTVHWQTLIAVLGILITSPEDLQFVIVNNGLAVLFQSFQALHAMFHQATACHITNEFVDLLSIICSLLNTFEEAGGHLDEYKFKLKDTVDLKSMIFLLNTYTPQPVRDSLYEVLIWLVQVLPDEFIRTLSQMLHMQHTVFAQQNYPFTQGPYFPKRGSKVMQTKSSIRPNRPIFQMCFNPNNLEVCQPRDREYEKAVYEFYDPYYQLIEKLTRIALKTLKVVPAELIDLNIRLAMENLYFHCKRFISLWLEIYNTKTEAAQMFVEILQNSRFLREYISLILLKERIFLYNEKVFEFMNIFVPKIFKMILNQHISKQIMLLIEAFSATCFDCKLIRQYLGDMRAVRLVCITDIFDPKADSIVKFCETLRKLKNSFSKQISDTDHHGSIDKIPPPNKKIKYDSQFNETLNMEVDGEKASLSPSSSLASSSASSSTAIMLTSFNETFGGSSSSSSSNSNSTGGGGGVSGGNQSNETSHLTTITKSSDKVKLIKVIDEILSCLTP